MSRVSAVCVAATLAFLLPAAVRAAEPARTIELSLDATEAPRKLLHARLVIPAAPGPLTLCYPKWIPGEHSPSGPINDLSGLKLRAGGKALAWRRDDVDLYAFHCTVPDGADAVEVTLDYLGSTGKEGFTSGVSMTERLAILNWHLALVYPQGRPVREQLVRASLTLPPGWKHGTALPVESEKGAAVQFKTVSLETLADSPVLCGAHLKEISLGPTEGPRHFLVLACDSPSGLELSAELKAQYERLVAEAGALFGGRHYGSYRFLVTLSDQIREDGIEHHECSDNRLPERFFIDETYRKQWGCWLLPHEYVHSWNGKYRRPDSLATPDFQRPMRTQLLWVYEGLTQYLGLVLAARSGLFGPELSQENFARVADWAGHQRGRTWRPLEDTTVAAPHLYYARDEWASRRRGVDFYDEGALLWLDVDTLIREKSGGKKSLDDFCRAFFGGSGAPEVKAYTFEDVVKALNDVAAHDWKAFLEKRLRGTEAGPPLDGLARGGWELAYRDKPGDLYRTRDADEKTINLTASVGLLLKDDGQVVDVVPGTAADKAGVGPGMKVIGVNGRRFSGDRLRQAVDATRGGREKLALLLENGEYFKTAPLDYTEGEKYPHLQRVKDKPDVLSDILRARAAKKSE
jgi:predicted metalloprotease with PDZ domain